MNVTGDPLVEITCADVEMTIGGDVAVLAPAFSPNYNNSLVTYSTTAGDDNFTINATTGAILWGANPAAGTYTVTINAGADAVNHYSANSKNVVVTIHPSN